MDINEILLKYKDFYGERYEILDALNLLRPLQFKFVVHLDYEYYDFIWHKD